MRCTIVVSLLCALTAAAPGFGQEAERGPTADETLILELINRCRADPAAEALRIAPPGRMSSRVDFEMFRREMAELPAAPPLVFDMRLVTAARRHSKYQLLNGQGHEEEPGKPGFSGRTPGDRARAAGFPGGGGGGENVFTMSGGPESCHEGFVVDIGDGPGGMQPSRGHRRNIVSRGYNAAGVGGIPHGNGRLAVTQTFGRLRGRFAGGVVYDDKNDNRFYDVGEGLGGVQISQGTNVVKSWPSGAYTLPLERGAEKITVRLGGRNFSAALPPGDENVHFNVAVPKTLDIQEATKLIKQVEAIPDDLDHAVRRFRAQLRLLLGSRTMRIDDETREKIRVLTYDVGRQLGAAQRAVREAYEGEDTAAARDVVELEQEAFAGTVAAPWFQEALVCIGMKERYLKAAALKAEGRELTEAYVRREATVMYRGFERLKEREWRRALQQVGEKLLGLAPPKEAE